ncbi:hypothetical protein GCM10007874_17570 [Labrys miyagiensis]|uniref:Uncharacterized protein n=1 Tax=Labrys miyagiensis TaxID=346912 RepID=A0ABQ6CEY0_9HYPH|nr:hypothetical protein [Labrys miyagiensis]GLS18740.1 hypothetical protein GCM10007874_17570 [Labrys miyagiensis]
MSKPTMSAAATGLPETSRRRLMLGGAATVLLASFSLAKASTADTAHPDEILIGLSKRWAEIRRRADILREEADNAHEGWLEVFNDHRGLEVRREDATRFPLARVAEARRRGHWNPYWVKDLPGYEQGEFEWGTQKYRDQRGQRRDELIAAAAAWKARVRDYEDANGYTARNAAIDALEEKVEDLEASIFAIEPHTLDGVAWQAAIIWYELPDPNEAESTPMERHIFQLVRSLASRVSPDNSVEV